jgi:hypothetical protein
MCRTTKAKRAIPEMAIMYFFPSEEPNKPLIKFISKSRATQKPRGGTGENFIADNGPRKFRTTSQCNKQT